MINKFKLNLSLFEIIYLKPIIELTNLKFVDGIHNWIDGYINMKKILNLYSFLIIN